MDAITEMARQMELARKAARPFDRLVVDDKETLADLPYKGYEETSDIERVLSIPVYVDETLAPGTIELRHGDQVIHRLEGVQ